MRKFLAAWTVIFVSSVSASGAIYDFKEVVTVEPQPNAKIWQVWIPVPYEEPWQHVKDIEIKSPYPFMLVGENEYGNRFIYLEGKGAIREPFKVEVKMIVERDEFSPRKRLTPVPLRYYLSDRLIPVGKFRKLAEKITAGKKTETEKLKAIYDYVVSHMTYSKKGTGWGRGDAVWACSAKRGNCVDFHSLFIALCRAAGIPARFQIGIPISKDGEVKGYHCWVFAYPKGWVYGIDASEAAKHPSLKKYYFGHLKDDRIGITIGRDILLSPPQHGERINFMYKAYEEVNLKPVDGVHTYYFVKKVQ